ncbi:nuclease-related domain-containing protein [Flavobacterium macacae]|uniref:NERD domain-containing protein n=1 Tax=Flavobacterium macacae TaxID=2488993 RepID=A0A3P3W1U6_9FLAO|nr:nuclease-related domain-containing protein [Flavobacterium macacae]RRJ89021.1 hypothetical protein EG849_13735 [Flavobacterium macacae]
MCRTYNKIGSLTALKSHLEKNGVHDFKSLKEVIDFQKSYANSRQHLIRQHESLIREEKNSLDRELPELELAIEIQRQQATEKLKAEIDLLKEQLAVSKSSTGTNLFKKLASVVSDWRRTVEIKRKEHNFDTEVDRALGGLVEDFQLKSNRSRFIASDFEEAARQSVKNPLSELDRKNEIIKEGSNYIYGALGEQKVAKTLEALSDDFFLINDFNRSFSPAIHNRQENDFIKSVQMDHILVAPSGIFLIETKNWSEESLENASLRSPVAQVRRANFALFYLLNNKRSNYRLRLDGHHWGDKKIPIRNLIVLAGTRPKEEFQYVKVLAAGELLNYVSYFKPIFSSAETEAIAEMILRMNGQSDI